MTVFGNRVKQYTTTVGNSSPLTLTIAVEAYQTIASAGITDTSIVNYVIEDGLTWEIGTGVVGSSGTTLTRNLIQSSTGSLLVLTGSAYIFLSTLASDFDNIPNQQVNTTSSPNFAGLTVGAAALTGNTQLWGNLTVGSASVPYDVTFKGANLSLVWEGAASELKFANNVEARFGANTNLRVYYDNASAGTSYIRSGAATDLVIMGGSNVDVAIKGDNGVNTGKVNYFLAEGSTGEASLHFYGNEKLATKTTGVDITGNITVSGTVDGVDVATIGPLAQNALQKDGTVTPTADLPMGGFKLTGLGTPTANTDAVTKTYVDNLVAAGIAYHAPVRLASTANLSAAYANGSSGVGATLTNNGTQAALLLDGIAAVQGDRVLIDAQSNAAHNGVYTVTNIGSASINWVLTRATDADTYANVGADGLGEGSAFFVTEGVAEAGHLKVCNTSGVITFNTTNITFVLAADSTIYTAGTGVAITGTEISIGQAVATTNTPSFSGADFTANVDFLDNIQARFGDNSDLVIHAQTGVTGSRIQHTTTGGALNIQSASTIQLYDTANSRLWANFESSDITFYRGGIESLTLEFGKTVINGSIEIGSAVQHAGNTSNRISFGPDIQFFRTDNTERFRIENSNVASRSPFYAANVSFISNTSGTATGDVSLTRPAAEQMSLFTGTLGSGTERVNFSANGIEIKTGRLAVKDTSTAGTVRFHESAAGANYVDVVGPTTLAADFTLTLPAASGTVALTADIPAAGVSTGKAIAMAIVFG